MEFPEFFSNLGELLAWLAGPLGVAAWMMYFSKWVRNIKDPTVELPPFQAKISTYLNNMTPFGLQAFVLVGSLIVPIIAKVILTFVPQDTLAQLQPVWEFIALLCIGYFSQQVAFRRAKMTDRIDG
jgi:hypothetical protein